MDGRLGRGRDRRMSKAVEELSLYMFMMRKESLGESEISRMRMSRCETMSLRCMTCTCVQALDT